MGERWSGCPTMLHDSLERTLGFPVSEMLSQVFYNSGKQNTYTPHPGPFSLVSYLDGSERADALE